MPNEYTKGHIKGLYLVVVKKAHAKGFYQMIVSKGCAQGRALNQFKKKLVTFSHFEHDLRAFCFLYFQEMGVKPLPKYRELDIGLDMNTYPPTCKKK